MRVLIVCSYNAGYISPFIKEQVNSLSKKGISIEYYKVKGKGIIGYLKNLVPLRKMIRYGNYDLIHAHYGLSGLLANLQRIIPVITTFHGSDVHYKLNRINSIITSRLSTFNILTNSKQIQQLKLKNRYAVIPCSVDTELFHPMDKLACRSKLGFNSDENIILFASSFDRHVKNAKLAKEAVSKLNNVSLTELKGYAREEVVLLLNASDAILMTSFYESAPMVVKEALACDTPVISTDVGDVKELINDLDNCYLVKYDANDIANKIEQVLGTKKKSKGRNKIKDFDLSNAADSVKDVYLKILPKGVT